MLKSTLRKLIDKVIALEDAYYRASADQGSDALRNLQAAADRLDRYLEGFGLSKKHWDYLKHCAPGSPGDLYGQASKPVAPAGIREKFTVAKLATALAVDEQLRRRDAERVLAEVDEDAKRHQAA